MMRDLSSFSVVGSSYCDESVSALPPTHRAKSTAICISTQKVLQSQDLVKRSFSQRTRSSTMLEHAGHAMSFIDTQQSVIKNLIQQLQIFNGYCEQLPEEEFVSCSSHTWSVYLMHAQALHAALNHCFMGKRLFGDGAQPPVRVHLEVDGQVLPIDLPDPCFLAMPSVQSFLAGVPHHRLPSLDLINACMAELLNALIDVQNSKAKLSKITADLGNYRKGQLSSLSRPSPKLVHSEPGWFAKLLSIFSTKLFVPRERPLWA